MNQRGIAVVCLLAFFLSRGQLPASGQAAAAEFLCKPRWEVGDRATYFATLVIRTGTVGNIIFEYRRTDELVWRGPVKWPEELRYLAGGMYLVRRAQLARGPGGRYRGGFTNKVVPPPPYEGGDYIDVYTADFVWAATVRAGGAATDAGDQTQATRVRSMPTYDLLWPITPMRRVFKTFEYRDMTLEIRPEVVDLGSPLGRLPSLLVADEFSYQGSRWRREAWYAPQFPIPVKRAWHFPRRAERVELSLELMAFERGPRTDPAEASCLPPVSVSLPSLGQLIVRAGLTRERPSRPPDASTERFDPTDSVFGYLVFEPLAELPVGPSVTAEARWLREGIEIHRWRSRPAPVEPRWRWFLWWASLPREQTRPGQYVLEWSLEGVVVFRVPFVIAER